MSDLFSMNYSYFIKASYLQILFCFFQLMDFYSASGIPILWCCFFQTIAIGWIFGVEKFALCVEQMTGYKPNYYWILTWSIIAPLVMAVRQKSILSAHLNYKYIFILKFLLFLAGFHFVFYFVDSSKIWRS